MKPNHSPTPWEPQGVLIKTLSQHTIAICYAPTVKEAEKNANLMALSPELLFACEKALTAIFSDDLSLKSEVFNQLKEVIAKAT